MGDTRLVGSGMWDFQPAWASVSFSSSSMSLPLAIFIAPLARRECALPCIATLAEGERQGGTAVGTNGEGEGGGADLRAPYKALRLTIEAKGASASATNRELVVLNAGSEKLNLFSRDSRREGNKKEKENDKDKERERRRERKKEQDRLAKPQRDCGDGEPHAGEETGPIVYRALVHY